MKKHLKIKNPLDGLRSRLEMKKEEKNEVEERLVEIILITVEGGKY